MKTKLLIAAVMFFALSVAAFAQATFLVGSVPVTTVASCGYTEKTGDITFNVVAGSTIAGTITITYPVPLTVSSTIKVWQGSIGTGTDITATALSSATNVNGLGTIVLSLPVGTTPASVPNFFVLTGARVAIAGANITPPVVANLSTTGNALEAGETAVTVISGIANGIASVSVSSQAATALPTVPIPAPPASAVGQLNVTAATAAELTGQAYIKVQEGFLSAFGVTAAADPTQTGATWVRLSIGAVPVGITLSFPTTASTVVGTPSTIVGGGAFTLVDGTGAAAVVTALTSANTPATIYYKLTTSTNPTLLDTLVVPVTVTKTVGATLPLAAGTVTVTANMGPVGSALSALGGIITPDATPTNQVPRYAGLASCEVPATPATLVSVNAANTVLLMPYAVSQSASTGFNTAIAISNTTTDSLAVGNTAVKQSGAMTFTFYAQSGTSPTAYTTSATSPGSGLTSGVLNTGGTYTVLLSELLRADGFTGDFQGYVIVTCSFTQGHGLFAVTNFTTFTEGNLMLVLPPVRQGVGAVLPESLGQ